MFETAPVLESQVLREALKTYRPLDLDIENGLTTLDTYFQCIAILTDVTRLCFGPPRETSAEPPVPTSLVSSGEQLHSWTSILAELQAWYSSRPLELHSLYEDEGSDSDFPIVAFVDDAGVSINMMYHVAMFVLLRHESTSLPRSRQRDRKEAKQAELMPLWHAQRVCGIALTSDQHCWDPCMIAAFFLAARHMTHLGQQRELLACLDRVGAAGWRIDSLASKLREAWLIPVH
ncbi:hypothetical protein GQ53DRAFT_749322 [Thozetella sp. PMI_491]|nr:hypothetical protein GQ53DRAFT_749322 [Thozetella sp. PMI_491]